MRSVRLFDLIQFDGASWQVVAQEGPTLALKNLATGRIRQVPVGELLGSDSFLPDTPERLPRLDDVAVLETLDPGARERALFWHRHVAEVVTGAPPLTAGLEPQRRPEYDLSVSIAERVQTKIAELADAGTTVSERSLRRRMSAYKRDGVKGLVDGRKARESSVEGRVDPRLVEIMEKVLAKQVNASTGTKNRVMRVIEAEAEREGLDVPSRATMYRVLDRLKSARYTFGDATTRRSMANRPDRKYGRQAPTRPGEIVEIDSTPLDLMVLMPDGSAGRADLTVALDIATRTPLAAILRPVATKAVDAAVLLAKAVTPLPMQPGWDASLAYSRSFLPQGLVPGDEDVRASVAAKPVIFPESITMDRGKVFVSSTFLNACERLQIGVVKAAPRTPTDKPHIERHLQAISTGFVQHLAGYVGRNVVRRGANPADEAFWPLQELQNLLDLWIVAVWQNRPHSGLRLRSAPRKDLSPNEMFAALAGVAPQVHVALSSDDYIALLPVAYRTVQSYGINFEGLVYDSDALAPMRGTPSGLPAPAGGKWEVRYDPYRMHAIFVRDHRAGRWVTAEWTMSQQVVAPFSLDVLQAALKAAKTRGSDRVPGRDVLAQINRIMVRGATPAERRAARRNSVTQLSAYDLTCRSGYGLTCRSWRLRSSHGGGVGDERESVFDAVAGSVDGDHVGVVQQPVQDRGGQDLVAQDGAPVDQGLVAGQDDRAVFIPA